MCLKITQFFFSIWETDYKSHFDFLLNPYCVNVLCYSYNVYCYVSAYSLYNEIKFKLTLPLIQRECQCKKSISYIGVLTKC